MTRRQDNDPPWRSLKVTHDVCDRCEAVYPMIQGHACAIRVDTDDADECVWKGERRYDCDRCPVSIVVDRRMTAGIDLLNVTASTTRDAYPRATRFVIVVHPYVFVRVMDHVVSHNSPLDEALEAVIYVSSDTWRPVMFIGGGDRSWVHRLTREGIFREYE